MDFAVLLAHPSPCKGLSNESSMQALFCEGHSMACPENGNDGPVPSQRYASEMTPHIRDVSPSARMSHWIVGLSATVVSYLGR